MHYLFFKVNKADIALIKAILESYENRVQISTIDENIPKIQIMIAPDFLDEILDVISDLQKRFYMQKLEEDCTKSQGKY